MLEQNLVSFIGYRMREYWNTAAFSNYGHADVFTYGDVARRIKQLHVLFEACGVRKGSKIALCGKNSTNWAITYLATITYGATAVPVLEDFHPQDIMHIVNH